MKNFFNVIICITLTLAVFFSFSASQDAYAQTTTTTSTYHCSDAGSMNPNGEFRSRVCNLPKCPRKSFDIYYENTTCTVTITTPTKPEFTPSF